MKHATRMVVFLTGLMGFAGPVAAVDVPVLDETSFIRGTAKPVTEVVEFRASAGPAFFRVLNGGAGNPWSPAPRST